MIIFLILNWNLLNLELISQINNILSDKMSHKKSPPIITVSKDEERMRNVLVIKQC